MGEGRRYAQSYLHDGNDWHMGRRQCSDARTLSVRVVPNRPQTFHECLERDRATRGERWRVLGRQQCISRLGAQHDIG